MVERRGARELRVVVVEQGSDPAVGGLELVLHPEEEAANQLAPLVPVLLPHRLDQVGVDIVRKVARTGRGPKPEELGRRRVDRVEG